MSEISYFGETLKSAGTMNFKQQRCERDYPFSAEKFMGVARI
ncbi:hypothetical protein [Campylobacter sp.]|nr:hypothetical protein [Campylobacter sp.]